MRVAPTPPPATFPVEIRETDPWTPRPAGAPLTVVTVKTLRIKFERSVDERRAAAKKAASDFFGNQRGEPALSVADDRVIATFTKPKPPAGALAKRSP